MNSQKIDLLSLLPAELEEFLISLGEPKYRAKQLFTQMHRGVSPADMTNIGKSTKQKLDEVAYYSLPSIRRKLVSAIDGTVKYLGFGPQESYIDKRNATRKDLFKTTVEENFVHYIKPQENGAHYGCDYMELSSGKRTVRVEDSFSFNASPYSVETLESTMHDYELKKSDATYLYLDYHMSGIGSNSCGPWLDEKYQVPKTGFGTITLIVK